MAWRTSHESRGATTPVGRIVTPEDIWQGVKFCLECDYFNSRTIDVDGGVGF